MHHSGSLSCAADHLQKSSGTDPLSPDLLASCLGHFGTTLATHHKPHVTWSAGKVGVHFVITRN